MCSGTAKQKPSSGASAKQNTEPGFPRTLSRWLFNSCRRKAGPRGAAKNGASTRKHNHQKKCKPETTFGGCVFSGGSSSCSWLFHPKPCLQTITTHRNPSHVPTPPCWLPDLPPPVLHRVRGVRVRRQPGQRRGRRPWPGMVGRPKPTPLAPPPQLIGQYGTSPRGRVWVGFAPWTTAKRCEMHPMTRTCCSVTLTV